MKKKQTAVDWLFEVIKNNSEHTDLVNNDHLFFYRIYQQAKQMEKEQVRHAYEAGYDSAENYTEISTDEYLEKTYGK